MASTIGQQLRDARVEKGLSVEDVAHQTRIHANSIRALEEDDYSGFASITYAKSFLQLYSRHLGVDATEAISVFKESGSINLHGSSIVSDLHESIEPLGMPEKPFRRIKRKKKAEKPGGAPIFLGMLLGLLIIAIPTFYFLGYNAENPEEVGDEIVKNAKQLKEDIESLKDKGESNQGVSKGGEKSLGPEESEANPNVVTIPPSPPTDDEAPEPVETPKTGIVFLENSGDKSPEPAANGKTVTDPPNSKGSPPTNTSARPPAIRATPLVARPVVIPPEEEEEGEAESEDEPDNQSGQSAEEPRQQTRPLSTNPSTTRRPEPGTPIEPRSAKSNSNRPRTPFRGPNRFPRPVNPTNQ
ncbi:MAG: hypothetical protein HKN23_03985 [Verrucomicrobiales bacterium]|nr:hypothetical protein [Verrucomicrobiales bacterium]